LGGRRRRGRADRAVAPRRAAGVAEPGDQLSIDIPKCRARLGAGARVDGGDLAPQGALSRDGVTFRFCDDLGPAGFGWIVDDAAPRTSHTLAARGKVWLVDALDWPEALERALGLGEIAGVLQILDRHHRDCAALARRLGVPHLVVPDGVPDSPFECIGVKRSRVWRETAIWWPDTRMLVVADALGTNRFYTGGKAPLGVHVLLRMTPPRQFAGLDPEHVLVGHGEGVHGATASGMLREALDESRRRLPGVLVRLPLAGRSGQ